VTLHVALVVPEGEIWTGDAQRVIAKTLEGDIGVLTGHAPVLGILAEGSVVRVFPGESQEELSAAVAGGFLSVADDRVSILARQAQLGTEVDLRAVRAELAEQEAAQAHGQAAAEESAATRYLRAQLRAAGDES
jgi:F-type H+-transporting ATPase subunit epsilon